MDRTLSVVTTSEGSLHQPLVSHMFAWASLLLVGLIAVLPFLQIYHFAPLQTFYDEWLALSLGFAACLGFWHRAFWTHIEIPRVALYCLLILAVVVAHGFTAPHPYLAQVLVPGIYLVWAVLLMVLAVWLRTIFGVELVTSVLAWFIFAGALLHSFTGLVQYLGIGGWLGGFVVYKVGAAVYGNIAQSNLFASHLTLGCAALIFLFSRQKISALLALALISFFAFIMTLSGSRAVALYAFGMVAISLFGYLRTRDQVHRRLLSLSCYLLIAFLCSQFLLAFINPWLAQQLADISLNSNPFVYNSALDKLPATSSGLELRTSEAKKAWIMFSQSPLLGVGFGNYGWHSFELQSLPQFQHISKPQLFGHSHNIFTQLLAETGIVGFAVFLLLIFGWLKQFANTSATPHTWFIGSALLTIFLHSNLEYPLWYSYFLGITAFLLAIADRRTMRVTFSASLGRSTLVVALAIVASIFVATFASFRQISKLPSPLLDAQEQINLLLTHGRNPLLNPYTDLVLVAMMPTTKEEINAKLAITTRAFHRNPDWYLSYKQATFLALRGKSVEAEKALAKLAVTYPLPFVRYLAELETLPDEEIKQLISYGQTISPLSFTH